MNLIPTWASTISRKCAVAILSFVLLTSVFSMVGHEDPREPQVENPEPLISPIYYAIPSEDPDDGKFLGVFGSGMSTLGGLETIIYIGVPSSETSFQVGIFDADITHMWDYDVIERGQSNFAIFKDPLKDGDTSMLLDSWTSEDGIDDQYLNKTYATDTNAQAPSGNFFYRLEVRWEDPTLINANLFKVRSTGQLSLAKDQEFGIAGAPQNLTSDPDVGKPGNDYDGAWDFYFYVPKEMEKVEFRDGDADRYLDRDDWNTPNTDPDGPGPAIAEGANNGAPEDNGPIDDHPYGNRTIIQPSVYYYILDPSGNLYNDTDPSGNTEWEIFSVEYNGTNGDYNTTYMLPAGLWQFSIRGLDGHNGFYFNTSFEIFTTTDPPLPVSPPPKVQPDRTKTVQPGTTAEYGHSIINQGVRANFDLSAVSSNSWTTRIYRDLNMNGRVDAVEPQIEETGEMSRDEIIGIVVQLDIPLGTDGMSDKTTVTATSQNEWAVQGSAFDITIVVKNEGPLAEAGGPYTAYEGAAIVFDGSGSSDPEGDPLSFRWDFESDGVWDTLLSPNPTATKIWGDDFSGIATLEVQDPAGESSSDTATWSVVNVIPSANVSFPSSLDEAETFTLVINGYDSGSDDTTVTLNWGDATIETFVFYNDGVGPDPDPSPDINPQQFTLTRTHTWGDDGVYTIQLKLEDDDGGVLSLVSNVDVSNLEPFEVSFSAPSSAGEGSSLDFESTITDPGTDDITFQWDWGDGTTDTIPFYNDGVGPDPDPSPWGTYPFTATCDVSHIYGDDGSFDVELVAFDDDGGSVTITTTVDVFNIAPRIVSTDFDDRILEGDFATYSVEAEDQGSDDITLDFDWGDGTTETLTFFNDGVGPDPDPSPGGIFPFKVIADVDHQYGDNGVFTVALTVSDDDGGSVTLSDNITVENVNPTLDPNSVEAKAIVNLTLRVSGEKWHDVSLDVVEFGIPTQLIHIVRLPGSPDEQSKTVFDVTVNLFEDVPLIVSYTPMDDPINGKLWGSTPVWVIIGFDDGTEVWLDHTFNVRHPNTWTWKIRDISSFFIGQDITFGATASDVGSDDLEFTWDWGDGTTSTTTYYNDGVGPDPFPSPDVNPITVMDIQTHSFPLPKVYTVTITVTDDDGGSVSLSFTLQL
jgi:hypothetical protein